MTSNYPFHVTREAAASNVRPTAILVWHGMGQQVTFETIEIVARTLAQEERRRTGREPAITPYLADFGGTRAWRIELEITEGETRHPVHIYEAYWAPLVEGKITLAETAWQLVSAGINGFRFGLWPPRVLRRFLFGRWADFPLKALLAVAYLVALLAVLSLVVINLAIVAVMATNAVRLFLASGWQVNVALLQDMTIDLAGLAAAFALTGAGLWLTYRQYQSKRAEGLPADRRPALRLLLWALVGLSVAAILVSGGLVAWHVILAQFAGGRRWPWTFPLAVSVLVWFAVIAGSAVVRWFLLEFAGDAIVYIESHKLNRFYETRQAVKKLSKDLATAIYRDGTYDRHILVAHSLGSVIAYDTLNGLILDDHLAGGHLNIVNRTPLFLTFGSPLDKIAFLFRVQSTSSDIREVLAAAAQPLINEAGARPRWVNIFSRDDVLGGSLEYFDPQNAVPPTPSPVTPIENVADEDAWIPLVAHAQFWTNRRFVQTLRKTIVGVSGDTTPTTATTATTAGS